MLIDKIYIDGFANLSEVTLQLQNVTAIVALNNFGKTNILKAIKFGFDLIKKNPGYRRYKLSSVNSGLPINNQVSKKNFCFGITGSRNGACVDYYIEYSWAKEDGEGLVVVKEILKVKEKGAAQKFNTLIKRNYADCKYKPTESGRCSKVLKVVKLELAIEKLMLNDGLFFIDILEDILHTKSISCNRLDADTFINAPNIEINDPAFENPFASVEQNISKHVYELKKDNPQKYNLLVDYFKMLFPDIEEINPQIADTTPFIKFVENKGSVPFKISNKIYSLFVKEKHNNQPTSFDFLSNGTRRIFALLTVSLLAEEKGIDIIAIEELENCIHPKLFQGLARILTDITTNTRVILTSHSPFMIQYIPLNNIFIGIPSPQGIAKFGKIKNKSERKLCKMAASQGITMGNFIFDLLLESEDDVHQESFLVNNIEYLEY